MSSIFFIHGMWSSPRIWDNYVELFQQLGYTTYTPALPQHFSGSQPSHVAGLSIQDYLLQLEKDYRALDEDATIIGHSMGGLLAQKLAERVNPKALVLLAPAPPAGLAYFHHDSFRTLLKQFATPFFWRSGFKPSRKAAQFGLFNHIPAHEQERHYQQLCFESGLALFEIAMWYADKKQASSVNSEYIDCEVLTLVGENDRITPASTCKKVSEQFGDQGQYHLLPNHGHWLTHEPGLEEIARQIHVWLCWKLGKNL